MDDPKVAARAPGCSEEETRHGAQFQPSCKARREKRRLRFFVRQADENRVIALRAR
jgi:hypothetical protein